MEEYVKLETRNLEKEILHAQEEVKRIQSVPLLTGQFLEAIDQDHAVVGKYNRCNEFCWSCSIRWMDSIRQPMSRRQKCLVFTTISSRMNLFDDVDLEDYVARPDKISGADINSITQEAGMHAVRQNRYIVLPKDFEKAYKNAIKKDQNEFEFYN